MAVMLNSACANNVTEFYVKLGSPPTRGTFDFRSTSPNSPNQQILVPQAVPGTYYVLVYGNLISTQCDYTVAASTSSVILTGVTPNLGANNATLTMTLTGAGFGSSSQVQLIATNGASFPATSTGVDSFTQITAMFASNTLPAGTYSVLVSQAGGGLD